jgi:hypothetical protein
LQKASGKAFAAAVPRKVMIILAAFLAAAKLSSKATVNPSVSR